VQGEGGVVPAPTGFLAALRAIADAHGALLLGDEVQTGLGRTGAFLGFQREGVRPDAVALAKALGGGFPIGAMAASDALLEALPPGSHGSTFGGNPLASAAALAVLDVMEEERLVEGARTKGEHLALALSELAARHPTKVAATRGVGLLHAVALRPEIDAGRALAATRTEGVLLTLAGGALRLSPPLVVTTEQLDRGHGLTAAQPGAPGGGDDDIPDLALGNLIHEGAHDRPRPGRDAAGPHVDGYLDALAAFPEGGRVFCFLLDPFQIVERQFRHSSSLLRTALANSFS